MGGWIPALAGAVPPRLVVEFPETAPQQARQIEELDRRRLEEAMSLVGLTSAGDSIQLVLAREGSDIARRTPSWISGFAVGERNAAILFPSRVPNYPDSSFEELVLHEVGHILVYRAAAGLPVPRWFNEGLALYVGRPWRLEDRSRVSWALLRRGRTALSELDRLFGTSRAAANHAYALSGAFVQDLVRRHGPGAAARVLEGIAQGLDFENAFEQGVGLTLMQAEESFWNRYTFWYRWIPILSSSATLWIGITLLFLLAARGRRRRNAELFERWENEEHERVTHDLNQENPEG